MLRVPSSLHIGLVSILLSIQKISCMELSYIHLMFSNLNLVVPPLSILVFKIAVM